MSNLKNLYKYYFIYKIENLVNKKSYVGFHATNKEFAEDAYFGSGTALKAAILKYGKNNFIFGIIEYINPEEWREKEIYWIKEMKSHVSLGGYNITWGGEGTLGRKHTAESIIKMKSHKFSEEHKKNLKENRPDLRGNKNGMFNKKHTQESIEKIKKSKKNISQETKIKISAAKKNISNETREKLSKTKRGNSFKKGKILSQESKTKISLGLRGRKLSQETIQKLKIKIKCPYCGLEIDKRNFKRWHGDKCKNKQ